MSSASAPVDITSAVSLAWCSPSFMMDPLPNCFSIWVRARSRARCRSFMLRFLLARWDGFGWLSWPHCTKRMFICQVTGLTSLPASSPDWRGNLLTASSRGMRCSSLDRQRAKACAAYLSIHRARRQQRTLHDRDPTNALRTRDRGCGPLETLGATTEIRRRPFGSDARHRHVRVKPSRVLAKLAFHKRRVERLRERRQPFRACGHPHPHGPRPPEGRKRPATGERDRERGRRGRRDARGLDRARDLRFRDLAEKSERDVQRLAFDPPECARLDAQRAAHHRERRVAQRRRDRDRYEDPTPSPVTR